MSRSLPPLLNPGSRVRIVSPSGPVLPAHLEPGISTLRSWELEVELDDSVYERALDGYLAGTDDQRATAINLALESDVDAVWFSRGGYGLTRIIHRIDFERLARAPKWVIGFSDVTAFHLAAESRRVPVATLHGHVVKSLNTQADAPRLRRLLFDGRLDPVDVTHVGGEGARVHGVVCGGNAALVAAMLGDRLMPDLSGKILVLEDVGEADYRVDRLLNSIARSRAASGVSAVVLGDFTDCTGVYVSDDAFPDFLGRLALEMSEILECPVYSDLPIGHGKRNVPIPIGRPATIEDNQLRFEVDS